MPHKLKADVLIVTVTDPESYAVIKSFPLGSSCLDQPRSIGNRVYLDLGVVNGTQVFMTRSEMGSSGPGASLETVKTGIEDLSPYVVIMVGIAFGMNEDNQKIGDILVSKYLRPYDLQRVSANGAITLRGGKPEASSFFVKLLQTASLSWKGAEVRVGTILTGEKLVDNLGFRDQLQKLEPEAIGGEMEGNGLYTACHDKKIEWILVKGICDWADGHKGEEKETRQKVAAQNAAKFVFHALKFAAIDWQQLRGNTSDIQRVDSSEVPTKEAGAQLENPITEFNYSVSNFMVGSIRSHITFTSIFGTISKAEDKAVDSTKELEQKIWVDLSDGHCKTVVLTDFHLESIEGHKVFVLQGMAKGHDELPVAVYDCNLRKCFHGKSNSFRLARNSMILEKLSRFASTLGTIFLIVMIFILWNYWSIVYVAVAFFLFLFLLFPSYAKLDEFILALNIPKLLFYSDVHKKFTNHVDTILKDFQS